MDGVALNLKQHIALFFGAAILLAAGKGYQELSEAQPADATTWRQLLPPEIESAILWCADHEEGTLFDWEFDKNPDNNGGGVFNTGTGDEAFARINKTDPFSGSYCAEATIFNAFQSRMGKKGVRLMRWTDKPWNQNGEFFPDTAYYATWMRLDQTYSAHNAASSDGGWWNVFQFKSKDESGKSQPVWVLNIGNQAPGGQMNFYLYSKQNPPNSFSQSAPRPIPVGRWFHVEALYQKSSNGRRDGSISVWQDGQLILAANNVTTVLAEDVVWGIGNYTDHVTGGKKNGSATIYFDDATVATQPTHPYVNQMLKKQRKGIQQ